MDLEEIPLDSALGSVTSHLLVETEAGRVLIDRAPNPDPRTCTLTAYLPDGRKVTTKNVPTDRSLYQTAAAATSSRPLRAFHAGRERVVSHYRFWPTLAHVGPAVLGCVAGLVGLFRLEAGWWAVMLLVVGIITVVVTRSAWGKSMRFRQWRMLTSGEKVPPQALPLPPLEEEIEVDDVKTEYGRLLSDIAYRIEFPALFDPQEPTSKAFTLALLQWDNNDGVVDDDRRRELASEVRATFAAAKANAERLGMDYLPEDARESAGTALKAARLAVDDAATEAERANALERAVQILDELSLYYLPTGGQARKAITGHAPLALPGRRG